MKVEPAFQYPEKRWADAKANRDDLQARYNGQPAESDADRAFKRVLSIWQEEKRP